jgi:archaellum component FlaF (FlaF/FlaG flagellin family)
MALRIRLLERFGDGEFQRVSQGPWRRSRPRASAFNWEHHVDGLRQGGVYRAVVLYRWYGADGHRIRSARVRSAKCKQPGELPNLRVASIEMREGDVEGTAVYRVQIVNRGASAARQVGALLRVDGEVVDEAEVIDVLRPGESRTVTFNGPVCQRQIRVIVDPKQLIPETREQDNVRAPTCL